MIYDETLGRQTAKRWQMARSTLSRWKLTDYIPDYRVTEAPLDQPAIAIEQKLIDLIDSGWLKAKPLSRHIERPSKISALLTARRYPDDPRYHVQHLRLSEIRQLQLFLKEMAEALDILSFLSAEPQIISPTVRLPRPSYVSFSAGPNSIRSICARLEARGR